MIAKYLDDSCQLANENLRDLPDRSGSEPRTQPETTPCSGARSRFTRLAATLERGVKARPRGGILDDGLERFPKSGILQGLRPQRANRPARFIQTCPRQLPRVLEMMEGVLLVAFGRCVVGRLQLNDHTGEALRQGVVDISRHSIAFFQDRGEPALVGKLI